MSAKIEFISIWVLSIVTFVTQNNVMFALTVIGNIVWIARNLPGACKNIKEYKNKVYARMVKKTDKD
jgi:hypothetical protein